MTTRREFVGTAAALLLPWQAPKKLPLGFSTLGCPTWPWLRILDFAAEHRFAAGALRGLGDYARRKGVTVLIESHGAFTDSPALLEILQKADSPNVALLWDAHHTFVSGKEQPEDTVRQLGHYIRHTHLKDSVPAGNDRRYVLTGTGEVPVKRQ